MSVIKEKLGLGFNLRTILMAAAVPLVVALFYVVITSLSGLKSFRYDQAYFSEDYSERYSVPSAVVIDLENALRAGDEDMMAALQGLRKPRMVETSPNVRMVILYEAGETYLSYLFWDTRTFDRYAFHVERINGRWVVAPEDATFFLRTGKWTSTWLPPAMIWWVAEVVVVAMIGISRLSRRSQMSLHTS